MLKCEFVGSIDRCQRTQWAFAVPFISYYESSGRVF